ncbi:EspG family protein [Actinopolyspora xinjiangensis]|uniref:EspG family protein n=1 Tax=Actinopolyspora xinjiangensis TaxID=405564 RepID=A0A1H0NG90_9ACTN|nr:ESX secretion-associated protein EspG [Actinopolyspora xinjiangensis]SDO91340.1 EspG family protein [Actinopolyspora xinjiangensis]
MSDAAEAAPTTGPVSLSALEFDVLLEHLGIDPPLVLRVASPGKTHSHRRELADAAWWALAERGLCGRDGLAESLRRMLSVLDSPSREVDGRCWLGRGVRVLAAAPGESDEAVLVVKEEERLWLRPAAGSGLVREALSVLPEVPAGSGRSVSLPSADLDAAASESGDDLSVLRRALSSRGVRTDDAAVLAGMLEGVHASGQFGAAVRGVSTGRRRAEHVVGFFDSGQGRHVQLRRATSSGEAWSTIAPADRRGLVERVAELLGDPLTG